MSQPIVLYEKLPARCLDYDPQAPEVAARVAALIWSHMPDLTIEHIGSTSIPGCAGKGVIDLLIPYKDAAHLQAIKDALQTLGFQRQTGRDPWPEDRPMRTGSIAHAGKMYLLHVHVVSASDEGIAHDLAFRDRLRADPALVAAYVARKREIIASGVTDALDYSIIKGTFVQEVLAQMSYGFDANASNGVE